MLTFANGPKALALLARMKKYAGLVTDFLQRITTYNAYKSAVLCNNSRPKRATYWRMCKC